MIDLTKKRIVVTGAHGFLGSYIVDKLVQRGCTLFGLPRSSQYDLRQQKDVIRMYDDYQPEVVVHCAAHAGGIGLNREKPAELFFDNSIMGTLMIHEAAKRKILKFTQLGTVCSYPKFAPTPFEEKSLWLGYPEETNAPYGIAKKSLLVYGEACKRQYGLNFISLLPVNLYGPRDHFHLEHGHVIPVLIRRFEEAKLSGAKSVTLWGTGNASREFLYVEDAAEAVILATERYNKPDPVNIGTGREIRIHDLATLIAKDIGYEGEIVYDSSKPDGQPSRCLEVSKAFEEFGFTAETSFEDGLRQTIKWYRNQ